MKIKVLAIPMIAFLAAMIVFQILSAHAEPPPQLPSSTGATQGPAVVLRSGAGGTISFVTQNGETRDGVPAASLDLPHLVLLRNGELAAAAERTLTVEVENLPVPPGGVTVTLQIETQHGDPDLGGGSDHRITVWQESRWFPNAPGAAQTVRALRFQHEFNAVVTAGGETIVTPTDYYRYKILLSGGGHTISQDYAFLMENQWVARLANVKEESIGAAPDQLVLYYCDMFPFRKRIGDTATWLRREEILGHLQGELVPAMVEAFRIQTDEWGFPWYQAWTSYRSNEDAERLGVALSDGVTWFHGRAPDRGHAGISITTNDSAHYATLTDAAMSSFYHELFHNLQRNINLQVGGSGDVSGADEAWAFFSEGTAVLASSVGQPNVQFSQTVIPRAYLAFARLFPLNESYQEMNPYRAALYWRFLYERCGGMVDGVRNPAAGMGIIRNALTVLYSGDIVDITRSTDLVGYLPAIMDRALAATPSCPFHNHSESLIHFARALYALRLDGGRCAAPGLPQGCGFYDPNHVYRDPLGSTITFTGETLTFDNASQFSPAGIKSSFGIDFVDVILDPTTTGRSLTIEVHGAPNADAHFGVQLWLLMASENLAPRSKSIPLVGRTEEDGHLVYTLTVLETDQVNRLGLIITRLDAHENSDPAGKYTVILSVVDGPDSPPS